MKKLRIKKKVELIEYKLKENNLYTQCPHNREVHPTTLVLVGSGLCHCCKYYRGHDSVNNIVRCIY